MERFCLYIRICIRSCKEKRGSGAFWTDFLLVAVVYRIYIYIYTLYRLPRNLEHVTQDISPEDMCLLNLFCWESVPRTAMRWAWTSRGLATHEQMAAWNNLTVSQIMGDEANAVRNRYVELSGIPIPVPEEPASSSEDCNGVCQGSQN